MIELRIISHLDAKCCWRDMLRSFHIACALLNMKIVLIAVVSLVSTTVFHANFANAGDAKCESAKKTKWNERAYQGDFTGVIDSILTLQYSTSTNACLSQKEIKNGKILDDSGSTKFKVVNGSKLRFSFNNGEVKNRMELRGKSFSASSTNKKWVGDFTFAGDLESSSNSPSKGSTVGQVFGVSNSYSKPILRIAHLKERDGYEHHLWAIYKRGPNGSSSYRRLGPSPDNSTIGKVRITYRPSDNTGSIKVQYKYSNRSWRTKNFDIDSVWLRSSSDVYFKAGCYLQERGNCRVDFDHLYFDD